ncbi:MAG: YeeE/YedE family protein [Alphaproteobacteria bacterium]|nr:YeeE/YedE family protein [Alphaproteobacteria bacterium]
MTDALNAIAGGALIGLAAVMMMGGIGRVMGVSGIISALLNERIGAGQHAPGRSDFIWRAAFVAGVFAAPLGHLVLIGQPPAATFDASPGVLVLAGLLVGAGAVVGSGCTSGHGVCGIARLSARSTVATFAFMSTGIAATFLMRHAFGG